MMTETLKQTVQITRKMAVGEDEIYAMWFRCPKCKGTDILRAFSFCPNCGVALMHVDEKS